MNRLFVLVLSLLAIPTNVVSACSIYIPEDLVVYFDKIFLNYRVIVDNYHVEISSLVQQNYTNFSLCGPSYHKYINISYNYSSIVMHLVILLIPLLAFIFLFLLVRFSYKKYKAKK